MTTPRDAAISEFHKLGETRLAWTGLFALFKSAGVNLNDLTPINKRGILLCGKVKGNYWCRWVSTESLPFDEDFYLTRAYFGKKASDALISYVRREVLEREI